MAKISAWILYLRHFHQNRKPHKAYKCLLQFSLGLSDALILANKVNSSRSRGGSQNKDVWRHLPWVKIVLKHCLLAMFILIKLHIGQALLPKKVNADYAVRPAECNIPNARSFSVYWLIPTVLLISMQNHRQICSCIDFFPNRKVLVSY